ncbi:ribonuclease HI [Nakamurella sp. UYEF19]|uniref:RNase H family protein n=1 Tax=Nakamurella sp. UYEF19 TaxID=1756392 RepID=UPI003394CA4D
MGIEPTLTFGTDGSCLRNPDGPTGWSYVCHDGRYSFGGRPSGTNQVGELMAILTVLRDFPEHPLEIQSDSAYAIGCSSTWKAGWQRAGYVRRTGPLANLDIIREIHRLIDGRRDPVEFVKVKAHLRDETVHPLNVRADELAGRGARAAAERRAEFTEHGTWPLSADEPMPDASNGQAYQPADRPGSPAVPTRASVQPTPRTPEPAETGLLF